MASIIRHTAVWSGSPGLPGYSQFYQGVTGSISSDAQGGQNDIGAFFWSLLALIPEEVTVTVDPVYQVINEVTGAVTGEEVVGAPVTLNVGTYVGEWSRQVGALVEWSTGSFIAGRRLRGRTYLVPLGACAATDGTLPDSTLATVRAAAQYIVVSSHDFLVWHRPIAGAGGAAVALTGAIVRDHAAILRSRMV